MAYQGEEVVKDTRLLAQSLHQLNHNHDFLPPKITVTIKDFIDQARLAHPWNIHARRKGAPQVYDCWLGVDC